MAAQTILWIPIAHRKYAAANGAKYDFRQHVWYIDGEIPSSLAKYVLRTRRTRDVTKETVPNCPNCGRAMVWIDADKPFWGCPRYRHADCQGSYQMDCLPPAATRLAAFTALPSDAACTSTLMRGIHLTRILSLLHPRLESNEKILIWLNEARVEFRDKTALELMETKEGFRRVEEFIIEAFQPL